MTAINGSCEASTTSVWRARTTPPQVLRAAYAFGPMRGDEVFTEEVESALAREDERCIVVAIHDGDDICGVGVAIEGPDETQRRWIIETAAADTPDIHHRLLRTLTSLPEAPNNIQWRPPTTTLDRAYQLPTGEELDRTILEMHAPLPLLDNSTSASAITHRHDYEDFSDVMELSAAWTHLPERVAAVIRINNEAFADHPEQGHLTPESFSFRTTRSWFDPHGLIVATVDGHEVGFVWMKCDPPRPAELYVVAVDPNAGIPGLGRALVRRGFDHAMSEHHATSAMLFVDASNQRAVGLYESLGFRSVRRQDVVRLNR